MKLFKKAPYFLLAVVVLIALLYLYSPTKEGFESNKMSGWTIAGIVILLLLVIGFAIWWFFFKWWLLGKGVYAVTGAAGSWAENRSAAAELKRAQARALNRGVGNPNNSSEGGSKRR